LYNPKRPSTLTKEGHKMSNEDWRERADRIDKTIEFIIGQQAQAEVRWAKADKRRAEADERWARTEEGIRALLSIAEIHEHEIGDLQKAAAEATRGIDELKEAGKATDERLNALISVVERQISERSNGKN
jgi:hypothetical protein